MVQTSAGMGGLRERPAGRAAIHPIAARATRALAAVAASAREGDGELREWIWRSDAAGRLVETGGAPEGWGADGLAVFGAAVPRLGAALAWQRPFREQRVGPVALSGTPSFARGDGRFEGYRGFATQAVADEAAAGPAFDAQLAHEVRSPLNAVIGFAELIADPGGDAPAMMRDKAAEIGATARRVLAALDDLTDAARLDLGRYPLRDGWIDAATVIAGAAGVEVPGPLWMWTDAQALASLIARLVGLSRDGVAPPELTATATGADRIAVTLVRAATPGEPLVGLDFALRLAARLAARLGGRLDADAGAFRLVLPALRPPGVATPRALT